MKFPGAPVHPEFVYLKRLLAAGKPSPLGRGVGSKPLGPVTLVDTLSMEQRVGSEVRARRDRERSLGRHLFSDPAWDILLALYLAALRGHTTSVSEVCIAAAAPATTALRWISALKAEDLLIQSADPRNSRKQCLSLTLKGRSLMASHFKE